MDLMGGLILGCLLAFISGGLLAFLLVNTSIGIGVIFIVGGILALLLTIAIMER